MTEFEWEVYHVAFDAAIKEYDDESHYEAGLDADEDAMEAVRLYRKTGQLPGGMLLPY